MGYRDLNERGLFEMVGICEDLFREYACPDSTISIPRNKAAQQQQRFSTINWALFSRGHTSPNCDEIRALVIEQLVVVEVNLEFAALHDSEFPGKLTGLSSLKDPQRRGWIEQLKGTPSEAIEAVKSAIDRLENLTDTIRQDLDSGLPPDTLNAIHMGNASDRNSALASPSSMGDSENHNDRYEDTTIHQEQSQSVRAMVYEAKALFHRYEYREAEKEYRKIFERHTEFMMTDDPSIILVNGNLANAIAKQGRVDEAAVLYGEMWTRSDACHGDTHIQTLACRSNYASMLEKAAMAEKAERLHEAVYIYRSVLKLRKTAGPSSLDTLSSSNKLANALMRLGEYSEAIDIYEETLKAFKELGEGHPKMIVTLGNLANAFQNQGRLEEAKEKYSDAMKLCSRYLDDKHPYKQWITMRSEALKES